MASTLSGEDIRRQQGPEMTMTTDLLDDVMDRTDLEFLPSGRPPKVAQGHECDSCGESKPDVDLWAEDSETGEQVWLCEACGEW